ncbi:MAG: fructosamine kinase family protein [Zoogloeaceae bacterium]|nr:fructosamine kinase family protein [Zoogloeaceae bacterium]
MHPAPAGLSAALIQALKAEVGVDLGAAQIRPVGGGCIHRAHAVEVAGRCYFLKRNHAGASLLFEAAAEGLAALAVCEAFRVPRVLAWGVAGEEAYLLLEFLPLHPLQGAESGRRFARALASLHQECGAVYGWGRDNFIGATPQSNRQDEDWARFFVECRLAPQIQQARGAGCTGALGHEADRLMARVPALFLDYRPRPSLLHGDLWSGNAAMDDSGRPVIFDPAVYRGDREADLAMTELFGGFPPAFYAEYRKAWPLDEGYEPRKTLYNLYHVLNHLNLFGAAYLGQAERMIRSLLSVLGG